MQRDLVVLLCTMTLLMKLLVPAGYMIGSDHGRPTITLCSGSQPAADTMPGMNGSMPDHGGAGDHGGSREHGKAEMPCAFSSLSATALGAVDPVQLAALVAFVMVAGLLPAPRPAIIRRAQLRPPLRGPPTVL